MALHAFGDFLGDLGRRLTGEDGDNVCDTLGVTQLLRPDRREEQLPGRERQIGGREGPTVRRRLRPATSAAGLAGRTLRLSALTNFGRSSLPVVLAHRTFLAHRTDGSAPEAWREAKVVWPHGEPGPVDLVQA